MRRCHRLFALLTMMLFAFSIAGNGFMFGDMAAKMSMAAGSNMSAHDSDIAAQDSPSDCEKNSACHHDRGMPMACFAHCASTVAVLSDAIRLPAVAVARTLVVSAASIAASHHGPPDPHPPKAFV
jgi:hypothetical protein